MAFERRTCEESVLTRSGSASACWMRTPLMPSSSRCASNSLEAMMIASRASLASTVQL